MILWVCSSVWITSLPYFIWEIQSATATLNFPAGFCLSASSYRVIIFLVKCHLQIFTSLLWVFSSILLFSYNIWNCWSLCTSLGGPHYIDNRGRYLEYCLNIKILPLGECMHCRPHWIWHHRLGSVKARQSDALSSLKKSGSHKSLLSAMEVFCRSLSALHSPAAQRSSNIKFFLKYLDTWWSDKCSPRRSMWSLSSSKTKTTLFQVILLSWLTPWTHGLLLVLLIWH